MFIQENDHTGEQNPMGGGALLEFIYIPMGEGRYGVPGKEFPRSGQESQGQMKRGRQEDLLTGL